MPNEEKQQQPFSDDHFMMDAINAWCAEYHPADPAEEHDTKSMYEILEALNSVYGMSGAFDGQEVLSELKKRGYLMGYDAMQNQFKIMVKN